MTPTIDAFAAELAMFLDVAVEQPFNPYADIYADWGLDSLQGVQALMIIESLAGALVPPPEIPEIYTLHDAYSYYLSLIEAAAR